VDGPRPHSQEIPELPGRWLFIHKTTAGWQWFFHCRKSRDSRRHARTPRPGPAPWAAAALRPSTPDAPRIRARPQATTQKARHLRTALHTPAVTQFLPFSRRTDWILITNDALIRHRPDLPIPCCERWIFCGMEYPFLHLSSHGSRAPTVRLFRSSLHRVSCSSAWSPRTCRHGSIRCRRIRPASRWEKENATDAICDHAQLYENVVLQAALDAGWWIESALRGGRADVMTRGQRACVIMVLEVQDRTASAKTADRMPQSSSSSMPIPNIATLATDTTTMSR
jgi:hypothetical protein